MRIKKVKIENYISLRNVELTLSNLTILVGKNGSGKTNILEALYRFFRDFNITAGSSERLDENFWFKREISRPIRISVELELSEEDIKRFLKTLPDKLHTSLKESLGEKIYSLSISRILEFNQGWKTEYIDWGEIRLVDNDKIISIEDLLKRLIPKNSLRNFKLYFFTEAIVPVQTVNRLLVDNEKKVAYFASPEIDLLVNWGLIEKSNETIGKNYREWVQQQGIKLIEKPPTQDDLPILSLLPTGMQLNSLLVNISECIKDRFKLIPTPRDEKYQPNRSPIVDPNILQNLKSLFLSIDKSKSKKRKFLREWIEYFLEKRVEPSDPEPLTLDEEDERIPIRFTGGGQQTIFALFSHLSEDVFIYGIEEPETHLHPYYIKKLFKFLKELAKDRQIIISTHSPLLLDKNDIENNYLVKLEKGETLVQQIKNKEELLLILAELGMVPSDIFLKDFVLFVEGGTEKEIFPIWGEKLGYDKILDRIAIIPIGGEGQIANYLRIWMNLVKVYPIEYLIVLDGHSKDKVKEIVNKFNIDEKRFLVLTKHSIEDYYPKDKVIEALRNLYGIEIKESDIDNSKGKKSEIERILSNNKKLINSRKIEIGRYIASRMNAEEIPSEIKEAFEIACKRLTS